MYPPPESQQEQLVTLLQVRLMKKLGRNAYPFTFSVSKTNSSNHAIICVQKNDEPSKCI